MADDILPNRQRSWGGKWYLPEYVEENGEANTNVERSGVWQTPGIKKNSAVSHGAGDEDRRQGCLRTGAIVRKWFCRAGINENISR